MAKFYALIKVGKRQWEFTCLNQVAKVLESLAEELERVTEQRDASYVKAVMRERAVGKVEAERDEARKALREARAVAMELVWIGLTIPDRHKWREKYAWLKGGCEETDR